MQNFDLERVCHPTSFECSVPPGPDFSGFDFWLAKLNQFNGNFVNAEMVKAFITSLEYRQRFVH